MTQRLTTSSFALLFELKLKNKTTCIRSGLTPLLRLASINSCQNMAMSVYVTRNVPKSGISMLKKEGFCVTQWESDDPVPRSVLEKNIKDVDGLFCLLTDKIDKSLLEEASKLKVIGTMSVGYDHVDVKACREKNIKIGFTPDVLTYATAELTVALLLATSRRLSEGMAAVKDGSWGTWKPNWLCGPTLQDSTIGIFGFGRIGQKVMQLLKGFEVKHFLYCANEERDNTEASRVSFEKLLSDSDFIITCCSFNDTTKDLFNKEVFQQMKRSAILVNTSRGGVINMDDLAEALENELIRGAGLDVTVPEPLPTEHKLLTLNNCVVLPHIGSATYEARSAMSEITARNIIAALQEKQMPSQL